MTKKDPAFLFYSKDFYEGTRTMLPEERGCYMDLLIYQHQHDGFIPNDTRRLTLYCSGCPEEVINHVLNQKFILTDKGWFNEKLRDLAEDRSESKPKKKAAATLAGLISSSNLTPEQKATIKANFFINDFIYENGILLNQQIIKQKIHTWFHNLVNQMVNNLANANVIVNENEVEVEKEKGGLGGKEKILVDEIAAFFSISEISNPRIYFLITAFVRSKPFGQVEEQFRAYRGIQETFRGNYPQHTLLAWKERRFQRWSMV